MHPTHKTSKVVVSKATRRLHTAHFPSLPKKGTAQNKGSICMKGGVVTRGWLSFDRVRS